MPTLTGDAGIQRKIAKTQMEIYDNILINSSEIVFHKIQLKLDLFFESHTQPHFTKKKTTVNTIYFTFKTSSPKCSWPIWRWYLTHPNVEKFTTLSIDFQLISK